MFEKHYETNTFVLDSDEKPAWNDHSTAPTKRCSYCGEKAKTKDIGDCHFEWMYYCDCTGSVAEQTFKKDLAKLRNKIYYLENDLKKHIEEKTNTQKVKQMKYESELIKLKKTYNILD